MSFNVYVNKRRRRRRSREQKSQSNVIEATEVEITRKYYVIELQKIFIDRKSVEILLGVI